MSNNKNIGITGRRVRRTKVEIEVSLFEAADYIVGQFGFSGLTVTGLCQQAKIEPPVFYNRYKDIDDFIDIYVRNYDYWLRDTVKVNLDFHSASPVENLTNLMNDLIDSLVSNIPMQKLIAWEINEINHITKRTAQGRDLTATQIIEYFINAFKYCNIRYDYSVSLIIGGLYYLIIHRNLGTFNFIDFKKKESIDGLKHTLRLIIEKIFDDYNPSVKGDNLGSKNDEMINVAKELIANNVDYEIIKNATKLNEALLKSLY